jgi:hypothetical protein
MPEELNTNIVPEMVSVNLPEPPKPNLYRIEEESTSGWTLIDPDAVQLTKERAISMLERYVSEGHNPNHLRVRVDQ